MANKPCKQFRPRPDYPPGSLWRFVLSEGTVHFLVDDGDTVMITGYFVGQDEVFIVEGRNRGKLAGVFLSSLVPLYPNQQHKREPTHSGDEDMGQYYLIVNLDKKEYIHPHAFGDGLKLMEFGASGTGAMCALAILLASSNGRGGGDLNSTHPAIGAWSGDRIVIAGDYDDEGRFDVPEDENLFACALDDFTDISVDVLTAMADDSFLRDRLKEARKYYQGNRWAVPALGGSSPKLPF